MSKKIAKKIKRPKDKQYYKTQGSKQVRAKYKPKQNIREISCPPEWSKKTI